AVLHVDTVDDVGARRDELEIELPLEPRPGDLHVQQPEEAAPEAETERTGGLRFVLQGRVVELQLVEGVSQCRVVVAVDRVETGEDHRRRVSIAAERLGRSLAGGGDRVTDPRLAYF